MPKRPDVLFVTRDETELHALQKIMLDYAMLDCASSLSELGHLLESDNYDAVLCAWSFPEGWSKVVTAVQQYSSELPVIVLSRTGGEAEWSDVLRAGAFDLVAGPFHRHSMLAVVEQAITSYRARRLRGITPQEVF